MAKNLSSINPLRLIRDSWSFLRSQPALLHVLVWFLIVPAVLLDLMDVYWPVSDNESVRQIGTMGFVLAQIVLAFLFFWGFASILLVGRRMVTSRAGRSRTSFRSVRRESMRIIVPLFFTSLLRGIITIEWSLLAGIPAMLFLLTSQSCRAEFSPMISAIGVFINTGTVDFLDPVVRQFPLRCGPLFLTLPLLIPAAIYQIRSAFFGMIIASEGFRYRDALRRSRNVVRGKTWTVFFVIVFLAILLYLPSSLLSYAVVRLQETAAPDILLLSAIADDIVYGIATLLFILALTAFYGKLRKETGRVEEVVPD